MRTTTLSIFPTLVALTACGGTVEGPSALGEHEHHEHCHDGCDEHDELHGHDALTLGLSVTHRAVASGAWTDGAVWSTGQAPASGAVVVIPRGRSVTVASELPARLALVRVLGALRFAASVDTAMSVETLIVGSSGLLQIGEPAAPVRGKRTAKIVFIDDGAVAPSSEDPEALRRGLIANGEVKLYGPRKTPFAALAGSALAGETTLTFEAPPKGWRVGDEVVIAATRFDKEAALENEVRVIAGLGEGTLTLDRPLAHSHRLEPRVPVHVANLTRNIVLTSERHELRRRGHVMLMNCGGSVIEGAVFAHLGRTDKLAVLDDPIISDGELVPGSGTNPRGRYGLHVHKCGLDGGTASVRDSVVRGSPGWGMAVHGSRANFLRNVVFDFVGAGFVAEDGNEIATFRGNIALGGRGNGEFKLRRVYNGESERLGAADFAFHGDGFWLQSPFVEVIDNVAAGNKGVGFFVHPAGITVTGGVGIADEYVRELGLGHLLGAVRRWKSTSEPLVTEFPLRAFSGNSAYGNFIGLKVRYSQSPNNLLFRQFDQALDDDIDRVRDPATYTPYTIESSSFWNNMVGVNASYTTRGRFQGLLIGATDAPASATLDDETWVGFEGWHQSANDLAIRGSTVAGYPVGLLLLDATSTAVEDVRFRDVARSIVFNADRTLRR